MVGKMERWNARTYERWNAVTQERINDRLVVGTNFPSILITNAGTDHPSYERCNEPSNAVRSERAIESSNLRATGR
ncbi:MAG: hypothetical protein J5720_04970 [Bacteroidaceae bacterium]|nr:hypothetical protein [Bacteroidaceae bacterium]